MFITNLIQYLTGLSPNGEEDVKFDLVCDTTWLIYNPQWGSNLRWISAVNEEISGNFISHLLDSGFDSVLESLCMYLVMDSLELLMVAFMGVFYSAKVYTQSDMSNVDDKAFSIMILPWISRKSYPVLYVWSDSKSERGKYKVIAGLTCNYHIAQVI